MGHSQQQAGRILGLLVIAVVGFRSAALSARELMKTRADSAMPTARELDLKMAVQAVRDEIVSTCRACLPSSKPGIPHDPAEPGTGDGDDDTADPAAPVGPPAP